MFLVRSSAPSIVRSAVAGTVMAIGMLSAWRAGADNWPQWRGAKLDGLSPEQGIPATWSASENVLWRLPLPGPAGATPVVWGERIFLTSADGEQLVLLCASTSGQMLWRQVVAHHNQSVRGDEGNYASPSPSTDGQHVWSLMGTGDLACFTVGGQPVWHVDLQQRYGKFNIQFGMASTPVLDGDRLYLQVLHTDGQHVIALDAATGREIWKQRRPSDARDECEHSYASPVLYRDDRLALLLTHGADYIVAHQLSDGAEVWRCGGLNPRGAYNNTLRFVASPLAVPGMVVVPSAKNGPVLALDPHSRGDITENAAAHRWVRARNTPDVPSPLVSDGLCYLCREDGTLLCVDAATGDEVYQKRGHSDRHRASPVLVDGKLLLTARDGTITVVQPGREFKILAQNTLGEPISSSPAPAGGRLYLRTFQALYAVGQP